MGIVLARESILVENLDKLKERYEWKPKFKDAKHYVIDVLAQIIGKTIQKTFDYKEITKCMIERENIQTTQISPGLAIPHGKIKKGLTVRTGLVIVKKGIPWDTIEPDVYVAHAIIANKESCGEHLDVLRQISYMYREITHDLTGIISQMSNIDQFKNFLNQKIERKLDYI